MKTDDEMRGEPTPPGEVTEPTEAGGLSKKVNERFASVGQNDAPDGRLSLLLFLALIVLLGRAGGWSLLVVVAALVVMIFLHELGHYLTAKLSGMKVTEFFFGFGPKLWSFQKGETEYGVKAIPAGAYVRIIGMNNLEEIDPADEPRTYRAQTYPRRLLVGVAGSGMHFLQAMVCLFLLLTVTGAPGGHVFQQDAGYWRINEVIEGSAAQTVGLQPNDKIVAADGTPVNDFDELRSFIAARPGQKVTFDVVRGNERFQVTPVLGEDSGRGLLGVRPSDFPPKERVNVLTAVPRTVSEFGTGVRESLGALGKFFSLSGISDFVSQVKDGGSGPALDDQTGAPSSGSGGSSSNSNENRPLSIVGAAGIGSELTREGLFGFLAFFLGINLFIGIVNLVPLLPLDGGHVIIATYERLRSRKGRRYQVDVVKLLPLTYVVVLLLGLLFVSTLFLDIVDPVRLN